MIEQDTVKLLRECDAGVKMGIASIKDVLEDVKSDRLRRLLHTCKEEHEKLNDENIPSAEADISRYTSFASSFEPSRCYIDLPAYAYAGGKPVTREEIMQKVRLSGIKIEYDGERKICHFQKNKYISGKGENTFYAYESLENIKARLGLVYELGLMGVSFDIMRTPLEYIMAFSSMFEIYKG